jgi:hypothetical protein
MYSLTIASTFNVAARTKTTVNSVVHMERPLFPDNSIRKLLPKCSKNTGPTLIPASHSEPERIAHFTV